MPRLITEPSIVTAAGNRPRRIEEYVGRINAGHDNISVSRTVSPPGWQEPGQAPDFEEITIVLRGTLLVEYDVGVLEVQAGQAVIAQPGEWIRYSTPATGTSEYVTLYTPAFSPDFTDRYQLHAEPRAA